MARSARSTYGNRISFPSKIPIEVVSDEEMAFLEAALARTNRNLNLPIRSIVAHNTAPSSNPAITIHPRGLINRCHHLDIEESGSLGRSEGGDTVKESLFYRFRRKCGLYVTDMTSAEWCEKQTEMSNELQIKKSSVAMKAGTTRHLELEVEVVKKVEVSVKSVEDRWGLKLLNFIISANQLLLEGLTREVPLVVFVEGVWMVGKIDELRAHGRNCRFPLLVDTKTRTRASLPKEPQCRNGRLQLMCYKYLWDTLVTGVFPQEQFFDFFSLDPNSILSQELRDSSVKEGVPSETLADMMKFYLNTCKALLPAGDKLLIRYELQRDSSLIGEDWFDYDANWVKGQVKRLLEFWLGRREASYAHENERWKCRSCPFTSRCPAFSNC